MQAFRLTILQLADSGACRPVELIDKGLCHAAVAKELGVVLDTLRRAVWDGRLRGSLESKLRYRRARFAEWTLHAVEIGQQKKYQCRQRQKAELFEEIEEPEADLARVKEAKSKTAHHIRWEELSEADRFTKPVLGRKRLMDAVRMIAYRAETVPDLLELLSISRRPPTHAQNR